MQDAPSMVDVLFAITSLYLISYSMITILAAMYLPTHLPIYKAIEWPRNVFGYRVCSYVYTLLYLCGSIQIAFLVMS